MQKPKNRPSGRQLLSENLEFNQISPPFIPLFFPDPVKKRQIVWEFEQEDGIRYTGKAKRNSITLPTGLPLGKHMLTVIVGQPLLQKGYKIYKCNITIIEK
ncbi:hypothetical protein [Otariodibacter oris]|uniref:Uncharacterized protein n=1 Tax=Otariodibacter oris TaxID=1032623 RepID=A0A420XI45_9PAST|nr:hypothetical protein [Otariodibacter oris]QGM80908.1 hypothetical protein A6A10_05585 [Otariodibacter oris]RKR76916.1 hypothetical protein DES31_0225 [Otariodibacter oris]